MQTDVFNVTTWYCSILNKQPTA